MIDLSSFGLTSGDWVAYSSIFFLAVVAKFARAESRALSLAIVGVILVPSAATCYVVALLVLILKPIDAIKI